MWILGLLAVSMYTLFGSIQATSRKNRILLGAVTAALLVAAFLIYRGMPAVLDIQPQLFQQFNPFFVVLLTPVIMAIFDGMARKNREPSAPMKIGIGMLVAALGYVVMIFGSIGQPSPAALAGTVSPDPVVPTYLMGTYLVLTFAELLLSPMGISFVTKVAPPKMKGLMMGLWFAASAIGNYLTMVPGLLWMRVPLWANWAILSGLCALAGIIMFTMLKRINAATR